MVRDAVIKSDGPLLEERGIDYMGRKAIGNDLLDAVEKRSPDSVSAALGRGGGLPQDYIGLVRANLVRKANQNQQFEYAGAVQEESRRGNANWHIQYLAVSVDCLPGAAAPDTEVYGRSIKALKSAGVV